MKENNILVFVKRPGRAPELEPMFENSLEAFQKAVGGYIETYTLTPELVVICNEEGKLQGLPYNVTIGREHFVGPIVVAGVKEDEFASLRASAVPFVRGLLLGDRWGQ
jgi:hypothetical protein